MKYFTKSFLYYQEGSKPLSIGTPKIINFPFVPNGKLIILTCPEIYAYYSLIMMCLNIGAPKICYFSILDKWKINGFRCSNT